MYLRPLAASGAADNFSWPIFVSWLSMSFLSVVKIPLLFSAASLALVISTVSGGEARAETICDNFSPPSVVGPCTNGFFTADGFALTPVNTGDPLGDGLITLNDNGTPVPSATLDVAFDALTAPNVNGQLVYQIGYFGIVGNINQISLTLDKPNPTDTGAVTKYISDYFDFRNIVAILALSTSGTVSASVPVLPSSPYFIKDVYSGSGINSFQNTVQTAAAPAAAPGPLPILGAGAAFRFSRKLRARVKASRPA